MEEQVRLELFTVQQVRQWLKTGIGERGLSEKVIARTRAWAIVNNPYATDELNIISAIFVKPAAKNPVIRQCPEKLIPFQATNG